MTIESILKRKGSNVTTIAPETSIKSAADWLRAKNIGALVVTSEDAVLGLISEREIVHAFSRYGETTASMPVKEIMQWGVTTVSPDDSVNRVMKLMTHHRVRAHAGTKRWQASRYRQHRRCSQASIGGSGA